MASGHIFQIFLRVAIQNQIRIAQWVIVDEVIQLRPLCRLKAPLGFSLLRNRGILLSEENKRPEPFSFEKWFGSFLSSADKRT